MRVVLGVDLVSAAWRNGMGRSWEVATHRGADGGVLWQVSIADLERDAPFSDYPGVDRIFTPIAGAAGPELSFSGGVFRVCPLLVPFAFPGDVPTLSRIRTPGRAFNVLVARGVHRAVVTVLGLQAGEAVPLPDAGTVVVHCLMGRLGVLGTGDTAIDPGPLVAEEPGTAILVAIR